MLTLNYFSEIDPSKRGSNSSQVVSDLSTLNPDILKDLKFKLRLNLREIIKRYASYVDCIRESVINKGITARDLCAYLLTLSAFSHHEKQGMLLSSSKLQLEKAVGVNDIFILLISEYASFLNNGIFQTLLENYNIDEGQEELRYPEHLKAYVEKHKIFEFIEIKSILSKITTANSQKMVLVFNIQQTCRLAKLFELENDIADVLGITPLVLRLLDVEKGCVVVTVLIPAHVAHIIFTGNKFSETFSPDQIQRFRTLKLECLKLKNREWHFNRDFHDNDVDVTTPSSPYRDELTLQDTRNQVTKSTSQVQPIGITESSTDSAISTRNHPGSKHHVSVERKELRTLSSDGQVMQLSTQTQYPQMDSGKGHHD